MKTKENTLVDIINVVLKSLDKDAEECKEAAVLNALFAPFGLHIHVDPVDLERRTQDADLFIAGLLVGHTGDVKHAGQYKHLFKKEEAKERVKEATKRDDDEYIVDELFKAMMDTFGLVEKKEEPKPDPDYELYQQLKKKFGGE